MRGPACALAALSLLAALPPQPAPPAVAITIDDGPWVGAPDEFAAATAATAQLLDALAENGATATLFVTGSRTGIGGDALRGDDLLRAWRDAGHDLQNHGFSHLRLDSTPIPEYLADLRRGADLVERLLRERDPQARVTYYRAPFNDVFADARERGDEELARRVGDAYLSQLDIAFDFAESLAHATFGRAIPHVLLIHANALNAAYLGAMLVALRARGYRFVALDEVARDPAFGTPTGPPTRWGWSWLHRWRAGLGQPDRLRDEPDPAQWVMDAAALRAAQ